MQLHRHLSHHRIWAIAGPMILANLSTPFLGMVDTAVVGHLNSPVYLGGVALGAMIFSFLFWGFGFLRMVTTGLTSQANGQSNPVAARDVLIQAGLLGLVIALLLLFLQYPIGWLAFDWVDGSAAVIAEAQSYYHMRIWSAPATLLNYVILGWLIGMESSRQALAIVLVVNFTNILFDIVLVYGFGMTADGVALASVLAEYSGLMFALVLLNRRQLHLATIRLKHELSTLYANRHQLSLHGNFMIRTLCLIFSFAFFTNQGAQQSDVILAANMVLLNFITFMAYVLDGMANATEVISGRAIGQKNIPLLKQSLRLTGLWSLLMALLISTIYWLFGAAIIRLLTSIPAVLVQAEVYYYWVIFAPIISVWSYLLDGLFVGATLGKQMRNSMLVACLFCYLPAWYLLQDWGNHGLWAALMVLFIARALSQSIYLPRILRMETG